MTRLPKIIWGILVLALALPFSAAAQEEYSIPPGTAAPFSAYTQEQLDQMIAPIALYPDTLVSEIFMAATYPLEIVEASRWLQYPGNARLQGEDLAAALAQQSWDPSVKSLIGVPQVLAMLNSNLQWTEQLGNAFLGQQYQVMDSVQRLRQMALESGHLGSTPQQTVFYDKGAVVIQSANPEQIYVPYYNPGTVYGAWPYPDAMPYYFQSSPQPIYTSAGGIGFGYGVILIEEYRGWNRWDWHHHRIDIDDSRFEEINRGQAPRRPGEWEHEPEHRHNVPYSPAVRAQRESTSAQAPVSRGFVPDNGAHHEEHREERHERAQGKAAEPDAARLPFAPQQSAGFSQSGVTPRTGDEKRERQEQHETPFVQQPAGFSQSWITPRTGDEKRERHAAPAFESFSRGTEVQEQSQRGVASRSAPVQAATPKQAAPVAKSGTSETGHINENTRNQ